MAYYELDAVQDVLEHRIAVMREVIPLGSTILDLGCNDGRIGNALRQSGHASRVVGVDVERSPVYQGEEFIQRDLRSGDLEGLPSADIVLFLNVAHHLLLQGKAFVRDLIARLLERYPVILIDMGSISERDDWPWRGLMGRLWASDVEMWHDLFEPARWRRPLLDYPFQDGRRVLWKLVGPSERCYDYVELERFVRNATNDPKQKGLFPEGHPGAYDGVLFRKLRRRETQELFWAKQPLLWRKEPARVDFEDAVERIVRSHPVLTVTSIETLPELGRVYPFLRQLFLGPAIHYNTRYIYLDASTCQVAEGLAQIVDHQGPLANIPLGLLTDFQCVTTSIGPVFLDWEPNEQEPAIVEMLARGEPARRAVQDELYSPMNRDALLERALKGAMHPVARPLTFKQRRRLAREYVRRGQRLFRAGQWKWSMANYEAAVHMGPAAFWAWLALLRWHLINVARLVLGRSSWGAGLGRPQIETEPSIRL